MFANQRSIRNVKTVSDFLFLNISFLLSAIAAQSGELLLERPLMFVLLLSLNILWFYSAKGAKLYDNLGVNSFIDYLTKLFKVIILQALFSVLFIFFTKELLFTRNFILLYTSVLFISVAAKQVVISRILANQKKNNKNTRTLAILGDGETGVKFKDTLIENSELNYRFNGFLSIDEPELIETQILSDNINELVIAIPLNKYDILDPILKICDKHAVKTYIIPDYSSHLSGKFTFSIFGNFPIITVRNNPLDEAQWRFIKRTFDLLFSGLVLLLTGWWLFPLIGIIIKSSSPGKVFFIQDRLGRNNKVFRCLKFRTMTTAAGKSSDKFAVVEKNDTRVTGIGKFLRKYNLDEFPQFINVFLGDMSIVGPRPHAIPFNNSYGEIVEEIKLRHRVKPGITGWAQIHGLRGDVIDLDEQVKRTKKRISYDIWYIENWRFILDIKIIFETVAQIVLKKNTGF